MSPKVPIIPQGSAAVAIHRALNRPELIELTKHLEEDTGRPGYGGRALLGCAWSGTSTGCRRGCRRAGW